MDQRIELETRCVDCEELLDHEEHGAEGHPECPACTLLCDGCVSYNRTYAARIDAILDADRGRPLDGGWKNISVFERFG